MGNLPSYLPRFPWGNRYRLSHVRVMLVGGQQFDKARAANTILKEFVFVVPSKENSLQTIETTCEHQKRRVDGRKVNVVICPDWATTTPPSQMTKDVLLDGVTMCSPGPHAVLLIVPVNSDFSEADRRSVEEHMKLLGDQVWKHTLVLFTRGYWPTGEQRVEDYIRSKGQTLRWLLEKCDNNYHVLNIFYRDKSEVTQLIRKVKKMVTGNGGHFTGMKKKNSSQECEEREEQERDSTELKTPVRRMESTESHPQSGDSSVRGGISFETGTPYYQSPANISDWMLLSPHRRSHRSSQKSSGFQSIHESPCERESTVMSECAVLVYEDLQSTDGHTFRIYLNCSSEHEDIEREFHRQSSKGRFSRVDKNISCTLADGTYQLTSEPRGEIHPQCLPFTLEKRLKGYFEAHFPQPPPFTFTLKASGTDDPPAWTAHIRADDLDLIPKQRKTSKRGQKNASDEEEPLITLTPESKADFVEKNRTRLIQRVRGVPRLADHIHGILKEETYGLIREANTPQQQMRILFDVIPPKGTKAMSAFYDALKKHDSLLFEDLGSKVDKVETTHDS